MYARMYICVRWRLKDHAAQLRFSLPERSRGTTALRSMSFAPRTCGHMFSEQPCPERLDLGDRRPTFSGIRFPVLVARNLYERKNCGIINITITLKQWLDQRILIAVTFSVQFDETIVSSP